MRTAIGILALALLAACGGNSGRPEIGWAKGIVPASMLAKLPDRLPAPKGTDVERARYHAARWFTAYALATQLKKHGLSVGEKDVARFESDLAKAERLVSHDGGLEKAAARMVLVASLAREQKEGKASFKSDLAAAMKAHPWLTGRQWSQNERGCSTKTGYEMLQNDARLMSEGIFVDEWDLPLLATAAVAGKSLGPRPAANYEDWYRVLCCIKSAKLSILSCLGEGARERARKSGWKEGAEHHAIHRSLFTLVRRRLPSWLVAGLAQGRSVILSPGHAALDLWGTHPSGWLVIHVDHVVSVPSPPSFAVAKPKVRWLVDTYLDLNRCETWLNGRVKRLVDEYRPPAANGMPEDLVRLPMRF